MQKAKNYPKRKDNYQNYNLNNIDAVIKEFKMIIINILKV